MIKPKYNYNQKNNCFNSSNENFSDIYDDEINQLSKVYTVTGLSVFFCAVLFSIISPAISRLFFSVIGNRYIGSNLDSVPVSIIGSLTSITAFLICGFFATRMNKTNLSNVLPFKKVGFKKIICLIFIGYTICMVSNFLVSYFVSFFGGFGLDLQLKFYTPESNTPIEIAVEIVATAIVPAVTEEFLFRGVLLSSLRRYGDGFSVFITALLFGLMHGNLIQIPFAFIIGLVLGYATVYTNSMLPAILIHCFNNSFSVISSVLSDINFNLESVALFVNIAIIAFVTTTMTIGVISMIILAKNDTHFLKKCEPNNEIVPSKVRNRIFMKNPAIIVAFVYLLFESIEVYFPK